MRLLVAEMKLSNVMIYEVLVSIIARGSYDLVST